MSAAVLRADPPGGDTVARAALEEVAFSDFRNVRRAELTLPPEGVALVGENGQGKTNLLEGMRYLQLLRSVRGASDEELVAFGSDGFHLRARVRGARCATVAAGFERRSGRKRVVLDGAVPERVADALGAFPAVSLAPHDAALIAGAPGARRRFLDMVLAVTSRAYLSALQRYRAALAHRNAALREPGVASADLERRAAVWEPALAASGAALWAARHAWVEQHGARYGELCLAMGESAPARVRFVSTWSAAGGPAEDALREALERRRPLDARRGSTSAGPHRDDLELSLAGRELRAFGSAGQQRTAAIALRLLEAATLRAATRSEPVMLLDDPFAELDERRAACILALLDAEGSAQTVLAVPRSGDIPPGLTRLERWHVRAGQVSLT